MDYIPYKRSIYLNGEPFDGELQVKTTTDPVIPIEDLIFGRTEGVKITTVLTLVPTYGEPIVITDGEVRGMVNMGGSILAINTPPTRSPRGE